MDTDASSFGKLLTVNSGSVELVGGAAFSSAASVWNKVAVAPDGTVHVAWHDFNAGETNLSSWNGSWTHHGQINGNASSNFEME